MCDICNQMCDYIKDNFGHIVDPNDLQELIESSPLIGEPKKEKGFVKGIINNFKENAKKDKIVRDKIKEAEYQERLKQAEIIGKKKIEIKAQKKIDAMSQKKKAFGFGEYEKNKDKKYNFITGRYE